jgi:hypothetical protein
MLREEYDAKYVSWFNRPQFSMPRQVTSVTSIEEAMFVFIQRISASSAKYDANPAATALHRRSSAKIGATSDGTGRYV